MCTAQTPQCRHSARELLTMAVLAPGAMCFSFFAFSSASSSSSLFTSPPNDLRLLSESKYECSQLQRLMQGAIDGRGAVGDAA